MKRKKVRQATDVTYELEGKLVGLQDRLMSRLPEGVDQSSVTVDVRQDWECVEIFLYWDRPETDKEFAARKRRSERSKAAHQKRKQNEIDRAKKTLEKHGIKVDGN